jgi:hypothetical protein
MRSPAAYSGSPLVANLPGLAIAALIAAAVLIGQVADRTAITVFAVLLAVKWPSA